MFNGWFSNTLYIQVHPNRFILKHLETGKTATPVSTQPFTTERLLVGQFSVADQLLRDAAKQLLAGRFIPAAPRVLIQPMAMLEGGLSEVEERLFRELAAGVGTRKIRVWVGRALTDAEVVTHVQA